MEYAGGVLARLPEVIDRHPTTGHDQLEPALWVGEDGNILQGVSINHEQIGRGSRRHDAHLPFEAQQACCHRRRRAQEIGGRLHLAAERELAELLLVHAAQQVGPIRQRKMRPVRELEGLQARMQHSRPRLMAREV